MSKRPLFTLAPAAGAAISLAAAAPVTFWNTVAGKAPAPAPGTNPVGQSRTYAIRYEPTRLALPNIGRVVGKLLQPVRKAPDND
jgi:hypothetical protein